MQDRLARALSGIYEVGDSIGGGGAGLVFRAQDIKHDRAVALKVLRPELAYTLGADRFLQEIRIAAHLTHPNILPLHDSGEVDGLLYYVMPFVVGDTLRDRLEKESQLGLDQVVSLIQSIGQGLAHAHGQGVIHRDIKPENILLADGVPIIADFGIARAIEVAGSHQMTVTGMMPGSPRYASPEQSMGDESVDARTDIYSLACVAFEMLSGRTPFDGPNPMAIMARAATQDPPNVQDHRADVPGAAAQVLTRALAIDADQRHGSVEEFTSEFAHAITSKAARTDGPPSSARPRSASWLLWSAAAAAALVATYFGVTGRGAPAPMLASGQPMVAVLPFEHIGPQETSYFTQGMAYEVASRIAELSGISVVAQATSQTFDSQEQTFQDFARESGASHLLMGSVRMDDRGDGSGVIRFVPQLIRVSDNQEIWTERFDAELRPGAIIDVQGSVAEEVAAASGVALSPADLADPDRRPTESIDAYDSYLRGNLFTSQFLVESPTRRGIEMYERATDVDPEFAEAYARLGQAQSIYYYFFDRSERRLELARQAVARATELDPTGPRTAVAQGYLQYWGSLDYQGALDAFEKAGSLGETDSEVMWVIGSVQRRQGRTETALETFRRGLRLDPRSHLLAFEVSGTLTILKRYGEARVFARRAEAAAPDWMPATLAHAVILTAAGTPDEARTYLEPYSRDTTWVRASMPRLVDEVIYRPLWAHAMGPGLRSALGEFTVVESQDSARFYLVKSGYLRSIGRGGEAEALADSARVLLEAQVRTSPQDDWLRIDLGGALVGTGRAEEAVSQLARIDVERLVEADAFRGPFWAMQLARTLTAADAPERALDVLGLLVSRPGPASSSFLATDPAFDPLRAHPRFVSLLDAAGASS